MLKALFASTLVLASASVVGCAGASDDSSSSAAAVTSAPTISLADAQAQVAALRARYEPTNAHELLFDLGIAQAYVDDLAPIFARTAKRDKVMLSGDALTYVSGDVQSDAIFGAGVLDDATPSTYDDLWAFSSYFGALSAKPAAFWSKLGGLAARSSLGPLTDLQVLELVTNAKPSDVVGGLTALGWNDAPHATAANAKNLIDAPQTFDAVSDLLFGPIAVVPSGTTHDVDAANTVGATLFSQTFSELRFLGATEQGEILYDLSSHLSEAKSDTKQDASRGLALAHGALTAAELQQLDLHL